MNKLAGGTLVLNRSWLAIQVCTVKRAISLLYQGQAKVIDTDYQAYDFEHWSEVSQNMVYTSEEFVSSVNLQIKIPRVIVLTMFDKLPKRNISFSRRNIFERDNYSCQYCGKSPPSMKEAAKWLDKNVLNLDHVIPRSKGGDTTWKNVVVSCYTCNTKKGSKTLEELGWKLKSKPAAPEWRPILQIGNRLMKPRKEWVNFLDLIYWNSELVNDNVQESK